MYMFAVDVCKRKRVKNMLSSYSQRKHPRGNITQLDYFSYDKETVFPTYFYDYVFD